MNVRVLGYAPKNATDFLSVPSFWTPEHDLPSAWIGHAPFAFWLVDALKPRSIVELGVHFGFSYLTFCQAVRQLGLDTSCRGVDTWNGDEHSGLYGDEVYQGLCRDHHRYSDFSRLIRTTFSDARSQIVDASVDLLHIDGCHHYEAVRRDFEMWRPKLSNRAVVLFHDTNEPTFGVRKFWKELRDTYPHFEFSHAHGLGVLGFGADLPIKLEQLLAASDIEPAAQTVRTTYARLGDSLVDRHTVKGLEALVQAYETSTSWRVTAPLRAVAHLARAFRGGRKADLSLPRPSGSHLPSLSPRSAVAT